MLLRSISTSFITIKMTVKIKPVNNTTQVNFGIPDQYGVPDNFLFHLLISFLFSSFSDSIRLDRKRNFI